MSVMTVTSQARALSPEVLRRAYSAFPTGVVALCGLVDGRPVGVAASSFNTLSIDPPLVGVAFARSSTTWPVLRRAPRIGISVLGHDQGGVCRALAGPAADRFAGLAWSTGSSTDVYVGGSCQTLSCSIDAVVPVGDHELAVLAVHDAGEGDGEPLVFHGSAFRGLVRAGGATG